LNVLQTPLSQPLAQSLAVVFAEALLLRLLPHGDVNFRQDIKEISGGLVQTLVEDDVNRASHPLSDPEIEALRSKARQKVSDVFGNRINAEAVRGHHRRYLKSYPTAGRAFATLAPRPTPLWFWVP
jgi:hypothetical protein